MGVSCVICEELFQAQDVSATPCGHTFHTHCIVQWLRRSKSCPQCRTRATEKTLKRLFFNTGIEAEADPGELQQQIDNLKLQLKLKEQEVKKCTGEIGALNVQLATFRDEFKTSERIIQDKDAIIAVLRTQIDHVSQEADDAKKARTEAKELREELELLKGVEKVLSGTTEEVTTLVNSEAGSLSGLKSLATFCAVLKKEVSKACDDSAKSRSEAATMKREWDEALQMGKFLKEYNESLEKENDNLEKENESLRKKIRVLEKGVTSPSDDVRKSTHHRLLCESPEPVLPKRPHSPKPTLPKRLHSSKPTLQKRPHSPKPTLPKRPRSPKPTLPRRPHSPKPPLRKLPHRTESKAETIDLVSLLQEDKWEEGSSEAESDLVTHEAETVDTVTLLQDSQRKQRSGKRETVDLVTLLQENHWKQESDEVETIDLVTPPLKKQRVKKTSANIFRPFYSILKS